MGQIAAKIPLKALVVEDSEDDLFLLCQALTKGGFELTYKHVQNRQGLEEALRTESWQIVISDFNMPGFDALRALELVRPTGIPFFVVSGTIGEEVAVAIMKAGAQDYVMKGNLARLIPAIQRELEEVAHRQVMRQELQLREEQLRQAQKMEAIGSLAGGIAHDFNNFLTSILMLSEVAIAKLKDKSGPFDDIVQIQDVVQRASAMTRQLLTFSRPQAGQLSVININTTVQQMYKMLKTLMGENMTFEISTEQNLASIQLNPSQLEQVLLNLIVNARDAMKSGGKITVSTFNAQVDRPLVRAHAEVKPGKYVVLSVQDNGIGMDDATLRRIFEPFFTTKGSKGTGLGLSTVFGIVQHAGGQVIVKSQVGVGSTFEIYLPACAATEQTQAAQEKPAIKSVGGETILLVEDQEDLRRATSDCLKLKRYKVIEAGSAEEAFAIYEKKGGEIDLLITDFNLPGITGVELIKQIQAKNTGLKFVLMSGFLDEGALNLSGSSDIFFLQKPFGSKGLIEHIKCALSQPSS